MYLSDPFIGNTHTQMKSLAWSLADKEPQLVRVESFSGPAEIAVLGLLTALVCVPRNKSMVC